jgi:GT2 family glycosyltransferase/glycosyltransferase involved in cell wall biosynthesis
MPVMPAPHGETPTEEVPGTVGGDEVARPAEDARVADLKDRLRASERALELAVAELAGIHNSRMWRVASLYWRVRAWVQLQRERVTHPFAALRAALPRWLPPRVRYRLVHAVRGARERLGVRGPGVHPIPSWPTQMAARGDEAAVSRPAVLCLPVIEWEFRIQRPQHLLLGMASRGWPVYYAALELAVGARTVEVDPTPLAGGVRSIRLPAPRPIDPHGESLDARTAEGIADALVSLAWRDDLNEGVVLCDLPFWAPLATRLRERLGWPVVYDRMDLHGGFSSGGQASAEQEDALLAEADLVLATSSLLESDARRRARRVERLRNGCDWPHWSTAEPAPIPGDPPRPIVGYFGAIAEWFDAELVRELAVRRPRWSFVLIGSTYGGRTAGLRTLSNVRLLGERPYGELPGLAASFDVAIVPFRDTPLTRATDPVKVYEMLALGLEVVASPLPELEAMAGLVRTAVTADDFLTAIAEALRDGGRREAIEARRSFAFENRWARRVDRLEQQVRELYPLVTIGIVTFGNLPLTRLCLSSLFERTEYPNFEVIVVDNGSDDGTPEFLAEEAARRSELTVICNDVNRGFAAANNQALERARGAIFCFLNNDTVLARGWLSALVRALRRNPTWGLVGPVTNAIGNQAKVTVGYERVEEMPEWAAGYRSAHRGESFLIPMLALFCAAMRRDVYETVGALDERFEIGMFEDDDYCRRVRQAGYELRCLRDSFVHHWQRASFRLLGEKAYEEVFERNRALFREKWGGRSGGQ